ncbi:hypothetical protein KQX64_07020 [Rhodopseudomonas palustris]|nr:hypothetical protein KQX64_07020 [Rhodopseudomonas palustris]
MRSRELASFARRPCLGRAGELIFGATMSGLEFKTTVDIGAVTRWHNQLAALGAERGKLVMCRALNHEGKKAKTQVVRALSGQTGLARQVIARAVRSKQAWADNTSYVLESRGGDVRLKFFRARETQTGVTAYPWGGLHNYAGYWIKGGRWPSRVALSFSGEVKYRVGKSRTPTKTAKSGVVIPAEMMQGATLAAFEGATAGLADRIVHEIGFELGGK